MENGASMEYERINLEDVFSEFDATVQIAQFSTLRLFSTLLIVVTRPQSCGKEIKPCMGMSPYHLCAGQFRIAELKLKSLCRFRRYIQSPYLYSEIHEAV